MAPVAKKAQIGVGPKSTAHSEPPTPEPLLTSAPSAVAPQAAEPRGPAPAASTSTSTSDWQRAAIALRAGELGAAEAALEKLENSASPLDRQAAELARAQLLVKRGMRAEATPALQRLAREGSSEVIRSQAASVLRGMSHQ
jgi:hypothetical protein